LQEAWTDTAVHDLSVTLSYTPNVDSSQKMSDPEAKDEPLVSRQPLKPASRKSSTKPAKVASGLGRLLQQQKMELAAPAPSDEPVATPTLDSEEKTPRLDDYEKDTTFIISPIEGSPNQSRSSTPSLAPSRPTPSEALQDPSIARIDSDDSLFRIDSGIDVNVDENIKTGLELLTLTNKNDNVPLSVLSLDRFEPRTMRYAISNERSRFQVRLHGRLATWSKLVGGLTTNADRLVGD